MHKQTLLLSALVLFLSSAAAWNFLTGVLGFGAYVSAGGGATAYNALIHCNEYYNSRPNAPFKTKLDCMADAVGFLFKGVVAFVAGHQAEEAARAGYLAFTGHQESSLPDLAALNEAINSHPDLADSEHPVRVEAMSDSNVGIVDAVAYTLSMGNYTDVIEHHTNGTHAMSWLGSKTPNSRKRDYVNTGGVFFDYQGAAEGIKLTTYVANRDANPSVEGITLFQAGQAFVSSGTFQTSDAWTWSFCRGNTGFAYGRIITEANPFGDEFEDVSPAPPCPH